MPSICLAQTLTTIGVGMKVLQFTDIDQIFRLNHGTEELKVSSGIGFCVTESKVLFLGSVFELVFENESSVLVIAEFIEKKLLISFMAFIIKDQDSSECV